MAYRSATRNHVNDHKLPRSIEALDEGEEVEDPFTNKPTSKQVNLLENFDFTSDDTLQSSDDHDSASRKRIRHQKGDRIAFSDDEDGEIVYEKFKRRKTDQRVKAAARTRKAKEKANKNSMVGKRSTSFVDRKPARERRFVDKKADGTDSENEAPETSLPQYVKTRRSAFDTDYRKDGNAALNLPPNYEDVYFSDEERMENLLEKPVLPKISPCAPYKDIELESSGGLIPAPIAQWLRDYQVEGAQFLHELFIWQRGGILGDDMGLGKTIQVIAFLTAAFGKTGDERDWKRMRKMRRADREYPKVLIICPGSLMANWKSELDRWGFWHADIYHGNAAACEAVLSTAKQGRLEIMITTYTTYRNHRGDINLVDWDCVVADECHQIKERTSEITKAMNEVNALCRIGLTGTAIQNKYDELWTLLNWTNPGRFDTLATWRTTISQPLKLGQSHDATFAQLGMGRRTATKLRDNLLTHFFLRRMKSLIADQLPKKSDRVVFCPLTSDQSDAYLNLVDSDKIDYIRRSSDLCDCNSGKKRGWCCYAEIPGHGKWQNHVFPCMMTLQKLANHLALLCPNSQDSKERQEKEVENLQIAMPEQWQDMYRDRDQITNYANVEYCGKWKILKKLLKFWHSNGDKVLIFSLSVRLLKMLQMLFKNTSYNVSYLDGSMDYPSRARVVEEFNSDPMQFVFLISTKAGGVGLNITSANKVVVFDPNWNPAWDLQAQDRAYRIGQTRDVEVFRLVSAGTVEEIVYARQIYKQQQANIAYTASTERRYFRGVQDTVDKKGEIFGLNNLFSYEGENLVLRDIVNKTNIAESKAGVNVVGLDTSQDNVDDDVGESEELGDENAVMKLLAAEITGEGGAETGKSNKNLLITGTNSADAAAKKKEVPATAAAKKGNAIQAILSKAGVMYTHENSEVIGSSKMEARLSKRALATGNDFSLGNEFAFEKEKRNPVVVQRRTGGGEEENVVVKRKHNPPEQVKRRLFVGLARYCGYEEIEEFALVVEGWSVRKRQDCLDGFYAWREALLDGEVADDGGGGEGKE